MRDYSLTHVRDDVLLRDLADLIQKERGTLAFVLAHIAEVDFRKLHVPLGYASMFAYCVEELRLSEDAAYKRIQAARAARQFPVLFVELAEGRLHLTAVCLLAPHLTRENAEELIRGAAYRRQSEIHDLLRVCRLGGGVQGELGAPLEGEVAGQPVLEPGTPQAGTEDRADLTGCQLAAQQVGLTLGQPSAQQAGSSDEPADLTRDQLAAQQVGSGSLLAQVKPLVPLMVQPEVRDQVRYLQALLSHALPSGDVSKILGRALELLTEEVEKRRFGTGKGPVRRRRTGNRNRYIPAPVRHAVWDRDGGRCMFVGTNGHRCNSEKYIEFDHVDPRNREDTVEGLRLRCDAHNQHEAERIFGTEFMARKREEARLAAEKKRDETKARMEAEGAVTEQIRDVIAGLRNLGIKLVDARRAAESTMHLSNPTLEERMRAALGFVAPRAPAR